MHSMRGSFGRTALCAGFLATSVLLSQSVRAGDEVLATPCDDKPLYCMRAPIQYADTDTLPIEWSFDTGWVPSGSPLQVHLWAIVAAHTRVSLTGELVTSWPHPDEPEIGALLLSVPGDPDGGLLGYHYGLDVGAQAKFDVKIGFVNFKWQGDIPYVPQIDFQVKAEEKFDAWGWDPGATSTASTDVFTLAQVDLTALLGVSIPGIKGGFELDAALDLELTYINERIVIDQPVQQKVSGGDITKAGQDSWASYGGGAWVEYDVRPEGFVDYDGVVHLIPAFFIEILGQKWSIPVADIPISFPITETDWKFEPQRVHVPLPDLQVKLTEIDFGEVVLFEQGFRTYPLLNAGEAKVSTIIAVTDPASFPLYDEKLDLKPDETIKAALRFTPKKLGKHTADLFIASNDPDAPMQQIQLRGTAIAPPLATPPPGPEKSDISVDSGCACRTRGGPRPGSRSPALLWALSLAGLAWARRRRRRL